MSVTFTESVDEAVSVTLNQWAQFLKESDEKFERDLLAFNQDVIKDFISTVNAPLSGNRNTRRRLLEKKRRYWYRFSDWQGTQRERIVFCESDSTIHRDPPPVRTVS